MSFPNVIDQFKIKVIIPVKRYFFQWHLNGLVLNTIVITYQEFGPAKFFIPLNPVQQFVYRNQYWPLIDSQDVIQIDLQVNRPY